ncbi:Hypothetical_protein [Hexamita inflata]|uniref:Hypothetical_protein n=1 Tax=Hexamita inflata TaxID=28002 RepID=A0ABP1HK26_9EUKA
MSNYREQTDYVFRNNIRKSQVQPIELNILEIYQTEEFSSIPVNETTNSNVGTHDTNIIPKKKPRQKSQVQRSQDEHINSTILGHPQYRQHLDEPKSYQKQVVNNFNCNNTSLSGQSKSRNTNKSEIARKSQNQQTPKYTAPEQVSQLQNSERPNPEQKQFLI